MLFPRLPVGVSTQGAGIITDNLELHLDAGDIDSYDGSSQTWFDLTANNLDFYRGTTSGSDTTDPTFNGTAGNKSSSEYFSFDGGDYFTPTASQSGSFLRLLGRQDQPFTVEAWLYVPNLTTSNAIIGNEDGGVTDKGIGFRLDSSERLQMIPEPLNIAKTSTGSVTQSTWKQAVWAGQFNNSTGRFLIDGAQDSTWTGNQVAWTSAGGESARDVYVGAAQRAGAQNILQSGCRLAILRVYSAALSNDEVLQNFDAQRARFGL